MSGVVHITGVRDTGRSRALSRIGRSTPSTVVITPSGRQPTLLSLSRDILVSLGKNFDLYDATRKGDDTERSRDAHAWLDAYGVTDIAVVEAQRLSLATTLDLLSFAHAVVVRLWLIEHEPARDVISAALLDHPHTDMTMTDFERHWGTDEPTETRTAVDPTESFPPVPAAHGLVFLARCRRMLNPADFALVEALHTDVFEAATKALSDQNRRQHSQRIALQFRSRFLSLADPDAIITAARAIQAACHGSAWEADIDEFRMRAAAAQTPRGATITADGWTALHTYPRTETPAVCALYASGLPPQAFDSLTVGGVADDGSTVTANRYSTKPEKVPVIEAGRTLVAAQAVRRRLGGAGDQDNLFGSRTVSISRKTYALAERAAEDTGAAAVTPGRYSLAASNPVAIASSLGLTIRSFHRQVPRVHAATNTSAGTKG